MKPMRLISRTRGKRNPESGQVNIFLIVALGIFFLAFLGFAVDYANFWFHRRASQAAADAACQAGAMDLLANSTNSGGATLGGFPSPIASFDCASKAYSGTAVCQYAKLNGYPSATITPGTPGTDVKVSFPASVSGVTTPPSALAAVPFITVTVEDDVSTFFSGLITGKATQPVGASATCGLQLAKSPIPIIVLHPTLSNSLSVQGNPQIVIKGGPQRSIEVDSNNTTAVNIGGNAKIDLTLGGPNGTGSDLGTFGGPIAAPGGFLTGTTGSWLAPAAPIGDPFAQTAAPTTTGVTDRTKTYPISVSYKTNGCPDTGGCDEYAAGIYTKGIQVKNKTAIFDPGIYIITGGLSLAANSTVRPSDPAKAPGDGSGGTMFFFSGTGTVSVAANSGKNTALDQFDTTRVKCPAGPAPAGLPASLDGNILLGPCTGTYGDPLGQYRGMLFFQDRSADSVNASWGGGGQFLLAGNMYFHKCNATGTGTGCLTPANKGYDDTFTLQGNSGSGTFVLGEIVTDSLTLGGTSGVNMTLNPNAAFSILKAELLQ